MQFTRAQINQFEHDIAFMENLVRVYTWDSCNRIRAHLTIEGKMKASEISQKVGLEGSKSVYKSLNRLIESGLVAKELEDGGSRNAYYYVKNNRVSDPEFNAAFVAYLVEKNKYQLIADYLTAANQASMGFLQVVSEMMMKKIASTENLEEGQILLPDTIMYENIISIKDPKPFLNKIDKLFREELQAYRLNDQDFKKGIENPAALYFAFVPLSKNKKDGI